MSEHRFYRVEDDLAERSLSAWLQDGLRTLEAYLAKHAAFHAFLESREAGAGHAA